MDRRDVVRQSFLGKLTKLPKTGASKREYGNGRPSTVPNEWHDLVKAGYNRFYSL